ncbi:MAG: periplasmic heavy metal sensor [Armatimonadetes bacterium]|nr:periplasmic heavy metal sensor [Armatimonadota bacterium]
MKSKWLAGFMSFVFLAGVVLAPLSARAEGEKAPLGMLKDRPIKKLIAARLGVLFKLVSDLDLSDEQVRQIKEKVGAHEEEIRNAVKPLVEKRRALRELVLSGNPDEKAIRAASAGLTDAISDTAVMASRIVKEVRTVLTPKQSELIEKARTESDRLVDQFFHRTKTK